MADNNIALMAHLMRRAGFGATRDELEACVAKGYEAVVDGLVDTESQPDVDLDLMERYMPEYSELTGIDSNQQAWVYRMINSGRPLQEKMALFWHGILCTGYAKLDNARMATLYIDLFREHGLGSFKTLLVELSRHPAMVYYLDNTDNHRGAINENYGRELLELFSLGVGMDGGIQLHGGRRKSGLASLHRLERRADHARLPLRSGCMDVPVRCVRPRQQ